MDANWPPPLASRAIRRHCEHRTKGGYCVDCGTQVPIVKPTDSGSDA